MVDLVEPGFEPAPGSDSYGLARIYVSSADADDARAVLADLQGRG
jgi:hypothetical protein